MMEQLIEAAKGWRAMARFTVNVVDGEQTAEVQVKLGETRRRWKRVAATLEPIADRIVGARGYDAKGELVGAWDAPDEDDATELEGAPETDAMAAHRAHTQWVMRETAKQYEASTRLSIELVVATIEVVRALKNSVTTPAAPPMSEDDAGKTLQMLLTAAMANNGRNPDDEAERNTRSQGSDTAGQGQPAESGQVGT